MLTVSSIAFAVLIAVVMRGFQLGTYDNMIEGTLKATSGHIQIQHKDWYDDKTIENVFDYSQELQTIINDESEILAAYPRFQNFALVSSGAHTKGVPVFGILPELETQATALNELLVEGEYLEEEDAGVLISKELAKFLTVSLEDSIVLFSQGYHGVTAVGKYKIKGIFDYTFSSLGNAVVYMTLSQAQELYGAYGKITSLSLNVSDKDDAAAIRLRLQEKLSGTELVAMKWEKLNKALLENIQADNVGGLIMISVLYMVIGFGIFGTLLMMAAERRREFSIINSIGMKKSKVMSLVVFETVLLGFVAVLAGMIVSIPIKIYFYFNPIYFTGEIANMYAQYNIEPVMIMSGDMGYVYIQAAVVLTLSLVSLLAPLNLIKNLNIVDSLRGR
ncbi:MAG: ABC transporter permease [Salibacteraceae bacterium]